MRNRYVRLTAMLLSLCLLWGATACGPARGTGGESGTAAEALTEVGEDTASTQGASEESAEQPTEKPTEDTEQPTGEVEWPTEDTERPTEEETAPAETTPTASGIEPVYSLPGGLYTQAVSVEITAPEGYTVRYTTDGSIPTVRSRKYTSAIKVDPVEGKGKVLRAACFDGAGNLTGPVVTNTYVKVSAIESKLFTVMISVNRGDLDDMIADYNEKIERPAHVEIVTPTGETVISQDAGLRLFGGSSRSLEQKSFKLIARKNGYFGSDVPYEGKGTFRYPLFASRMVVAGDKAGQVLDRYDSFVLRNGGNDSLLHVAEDPTHAALVRDGLINNFAYTYAPHVEVGLSHFAAVYVNGAYYGLLDMRENQNEDLIKRIYGVDDADVVVVKSELDTTRACKDHEDHGGAACRFCGSWFFYETDDNAAAQAEMAAWIALCKETIAAMNQGAAAYNAAYEKLAARVDLDSFMEYMALGLYVCNTDWPHNNVKLYRYTGAVVEGNPITDGKWRFMTRDMDMAMARYSSPEVLPELDSRVSVDPFWRVLGNYVDGYDSLYRDGGETKLYADALYLQGLFAFCLKNKDFRDAFAAYAVSLASDEAVAAMEDAYDTAAAQVRGGVVAHIKRWQNKLPDGYSAVTWRSSAARVEKFIKDRPAYFIDFLNLALSMY